MPILLQECSVNSPDSGPPAPNSPAWCLAPFDPEGILRLVISQFVFVSSMKYVLSNQIYLSSRIISQSSVVLIQELKVRNLYIVFKLLSLLLRLNFWLYTIANLVVLNCSFFISINEFSSLMAAITCLVGLHYGHILVHCKVICFFFFLARRGCKPMNCFYL